MIGETYECEEHEKECKYNLSSKHCNTCMHDVACEYTCNSLCAFTSDPKYERIN